MSTGYIEYFKTSVYPHIKDFDFVHDLAEYNHKRVGLSLNTETQNIPSLADYTNLETLHCFRVSEAQLKDLPKLNTVKNLNMMASTIEDLSFLKQFPNLIFLTIDGCPNLLSTSGLAALSQIKILSFVGNLNLRDYTEVAALKNLTVLKLTGTTAGSTLKMGNLKWLSSLQNLEDLTLENISTPKGELSPIAKLRNLKRLIIPAKSKLEQIAYLMGSLPDTKCFHFAPFHTAFNKHDEFLNCVNCGTPKIRLTGRGKGRVICKKCDVEILDLHMKTFNEWSERGRKERDG
ncbi:hypothetical protein BKI52_39115 [marine bacterium AO1-C]|nr:hypothetical protein BKI52_39115 [marine bacterium AO1-C]